MEPILKSESDASRVISPSYGILTSIFKGSPLNGPESWSPQINSPGCDGDAVVGLADGSALGALVGSDVGSADGSAVGSIVGFVVGDCVGIDVGSIVGSAVGSVVGSLVGFAVGADVGLWGDKTYSRSIRLVMTAINRKENE